MRKLVIALNLLLVLNSVGYGQTTIIVDNFENSFNWFVSAGETPTFFTGTSGSGDAPAFSSFSTQGAYSAGKPGTTMGEVAFFSPPIDVTGYTNIQCSFRLAAFSLGSTTNGLDASVDAVQVFVSPNGGTSSYPTVEVRGNNNANWSFTSGTGVASTPYDGNGSIVTYMPSGGGSRTTDGYSTVTITNLPRVSQLIIRIVMNNTHASEAWMIDEFRLTGTPDANPFITTVPMALTGFGAVIGGNISGVISYQVRGGNLTNNIDITAPTGYEISSASGGPFATNLSLTPVSGTVPITNVYVRMNTTTLGTNAGNIVHSSTGASNQNVSVSGVLVSLQPTVNPTVSFSNVGGDALTINFSGGNGDGRIVLVNPTNSTILNPAAGVPYNPNPELGLGDRIGISYVVYKGNGGSVTIAGLSPNTTYYVRVFEYNDNGIPSSVHYTSTAPTVNVTTGNLNEGFELVSTNTLYTIDFDNTVPKVNNGAFAGLSARPAPAVGELNSNAFSLNQTLINGPAKFGGTITDGQGTSTGNVTTPGFYAFEHTPANVGFGIQMGDGVWTNGQLTIRLQNNTGTTLTQLAVAFTYLVRNDGDRDLSFDALFSTNNISYANFVNDTLYGPIDPVPTWKAYLRGFQATGLSVPNGQHVYLRFTVGDYDSEGGERDEIIIDDIKFVANPTTIFPRVSGNFENIRSNGWIQLGGPTTARTIYLFGAASIELGNHNLTVNEWVGRFGSAYILTNGTGNLIINNVSGPLLFPVGNARYNPVTISNGSNLNWSVRVDDAVLNPGFPLDQTRAVQRTWSITPSINPPPAGANVTFQYNDGDPTQIGSNFNPNEQVQVWHNNGFVWANVTPGITPTGTAGSTRTVTLNNWSTFSPFTIANVSAALPVKFTNVKAEKIGSRIKVSWSNLTESNVNKYIIERSADGRLFNFIGEKPATVNNGGRADYSAFDDMPLQGVNYYRIVALEIDGAKVLSSIVRIDPNNLQSQLTVYPTKVQRGAQVFISMSNLERGSYMIKLIGMSGQVLQRQLIQYNGGSVTLPVEVPGNIQKGVYILEVLNAGQKFQQRLVVSE